MKLDIIYSTRGRMPGSIHPWRMHACYMMARSRTHQLIGRHCMESYRVIYRYLSVGLSCIVAISYSNVK